MKSHPQLWNRTKGRTWTCCLSMSPLLVPSSLSQLKNPYGSPAAWRIDSRLHSQAPRLSNLDCLQLPCVILPDQPDGRSATQTCSVHIVFCHNTLTLAVILHSTVSGPPFPDHPIQSVHFSSEPQHGQSVPCSRITSLRTQSLLTCLASICVCACVWVCIHMHVCLDLQLT